METYELLTALRGVVSNIVSKGARALVLFGSIARGVDFIPCRSDVDILVVMDREDYHEDYISFKGYEVKLSISYYSPRTLYEMARKLHPLLLHIYKASIVYHDDGILASILHSIPQKTTEYTVKVEKHSTMVALALALEKLYLGYSEEALDHIHHALRHLARALVGEGKPITMFPTYDLEATIVLENKDRELKQLFNTVRTERMKCKTTSNTVKELLSRAWSLSSKHIGLKTPTLTKVLEKCSNNRTLPIKIPLIVDLEDNTITITCGDVTVEP